jgi:hypothetical protein
MSVCLSHLFKVTDGGKDKFEDPVGLTWTCVLLSAKCYLFSKFFLLTRCLEYGESAEENFRHCHHMQGFPVSFFLKYCTHHRHEPAAGTQPNTALPKIYTLLHQICVLKISVYYVRWSLHREIYISNCPTRCTTIYSLFIFVNCSTCFEW